MVGTTRLGSGGSLFIGTASVAVAMGSAAACGVAAGTVIAGSASLCVAGCSPSGASGLSGAIEATCTGALCAWV